MHGGSALELCYERTVMVAQELGACVEVRWSCDEGIVMVLKDLGA